MVVFALPKQQASKCSTNWVELILDEATAGDIAAVSGIEPIEIGDTLCCSNNPQPLARLAVDEPTLSMVFGINTSPLAGRSGTFLTTRHLRATK